MEFLNDDLELLNIIENGFPRRRYHRFEYMEDMDEHRFFQRFRLTKPTVRTVRSIVPLIQDRLELDGGRFGNNTVSPTNQLLTTLRLYATGGHLSSVGDFMAMDVGTASKIVKRTSRALASLRPIYVRMPLLNDAEMVQVQRDFFNISSFPRVIGTIDGTHIRIQSPGGADGEIFRNRKGYYSINLQLVVDAKLRIQDIVARWPGSQHDNTIFHHSRIRGRFENGEFPNCVLLGDSGYALRNYLLTPLAQPQGRGQALYNEAHIRTRNISERTNGVLKRRFPILAYGMRLKLETALTVIVACGVLHNIARNMNEPEPPAQEDMNLQELNYLIEMGDIPEQVGNMRDGNHFMYRNEIINYFERLH